MFIRKTHRNKLLYRSVLFFLSVQLTVAANQNINFFEKKIRPVLSKNCYECHSAKSKSLKAGLLLDRKAGWERGGKNGSVIIPGEPAKSILINALRYGNHDLQMPPSGKLSEPVLADFEKWISMGAQDPRNSPLEEVFAVGGLRAKSLEEGKKFWAFKPIKLPSLPDVQRDEWIKDEIDRFILRGIENKKLQPEEWEGNTFTISNLGMFGIEAFTAIVNPPDSCILAIGGIKAVPVVKDGQVVPGNVMKVTLSCDHRVVDGATGSAFLNTFKNYMENPVSMLM